MKASDETNSHKVILLGGRSRAAAAIREELGAQRCIGVVRSGPGERDVATPDYAQVPGNLDLAGSIIVNCVGSPVGDADALMRLNRDVPLAWVEAGRAQGARGFVHISSFSIFGPVEAVDTSTPTRPMSDYGRSKLAAERALGESNVPDFPIAMLRVPILVGGGPDKLSQLVSLGSRTGFIPSASRPTPRSMLPYGGLARAVRLAIEGRLDGPVHAADPEPFTPQLLRKEAAKQGRRIRIARLPRPATALIAKAAPGLHASLLSPNLLAGEANLIANETGYERLRDVVARLLA